MCYQYVKIKWLGDVIIPAQFQTQCFIQLSPAGCDKDDRQVELIFELAHGIQSVHNRQADIQQHQVWFIQAAPVRGQFLRSLQYWHGNQPVPG